MNDASTRITITLILITFIIHDRLYMRRPIHSASFLMLFSIFFINFFVFFRERDVFCPIASRSWVSVFSTQVYNWDLGGSASLARFAPVRLGVLVFLSYNMMVSKKLFDRHQDLNSYGIFDASKSYGNIGLRGMLVFGLSVASSYSEEKETQLPGA